LKVYGIFRIYCGLSEITADGVFLKGKGQFTMVTPIYIESENAIAHVIIWDAGCFLEKINNANVLRIPLPVLITFSTSKQSAAVKYPSEQVHSFADIQGVLKSMHE
jgi:hypothetical protein